MNRYIDADKAVRLLQGRLMETANNNCGFKCDAGSVFQDAAERIPRWIDEIPTAQPTLYGYNIEHLELIARILQKENLPPERIVEALTDIGRIVAIITDEFEETLRKAVDLTGAPFLEHRSGIGL